MQRYIVEMLKRSIRIYTRNRNVKGITVSTIIEEYNIYVL
jgi:hypothetical protein